MKGMAVLLALPVGGWINANSEEEPEYIKLQLTGDGIRIVKCRQNGAWRSATAEAQIQFLH